MHSSCFNSVIEEPPDPYYTFDAISLFPPPIPWFMKHVHASQSTSHLKHSLITGTANAVSDGSCFPLQKIGSYDWVISSADGREWISGSGLIPGEPAAQNSYRSEFG